MRKLPSIVMPALLVASLAACADDDSPNTSATRPVETAPLAPTVAQLTLSPRADEWGPIIEVGIVAPDGAAQMQVGLDPNQPDDSWGPVEPNLVLRAHEGYQEVFARFRDASGATGPWTVAGVEVDTRAEAATADPPRPAVVGLVTPDAIEVVIEVGRVRRGVGRAGDDYVGPSVEGGTLDDGWTLEGSDAPGVRVVRRVSVPTDGGRDDNGDVTRFPMRHTVTLQTDRPLEPGENFEVRTPLGSTVTLAVDDRSTLSPAVHVNQVAHAPGDAKVAYWSVPDDIPLDDAGPVGFAVVDEAGREVFAGTGEIRDVADEAGRGDVTGARVQRLDFSAVTEPGRYRVCVDGVGCSTPVEVSERAWGALATTIARSLLYNRSGIELNAPYSSFVRPRPDHPDDGTVVLETRLTGFEASELTDETLFDAIAAGATDIPVDDAWGGHFDAGDWDRRTQHLFMSRQLLDVARRWPQAFGDDSLNLPESGNGIDDLVDEALWTLDLFHRLQRSDGAVRGGIESRRFPEWGIPSWTDTITRYAYAPDAWTSWVYASVAADAALLLADADAERAERYATSAVAAWDWAENQPTPTVEGDPTNAKVLSQRAAAAAALLELTGEQRFAVAFERDSAFAGGPVSPLACHANEWCDAGWRYLALPDDLTDPTVRDNIVASFADVAGRIAEAAERTRFGWCVEDPGVPLVWGMGPGGNAHVVTLLRAALATGDDRWWGVAQRCAAVSLGANPSNTSFVTGRGTNPVRHPLVVDAAFGGVPVWPGIPVYGTHPLWDLWWVVEWRLAPAGSNLDPANLPLLESWLDLPDVAAMNEFTVFQSQAPMVWAATALAASAGEFDAG